MLSRKQAILNMLIEMKIKVLFQNLETGDDRKDFFKKDYSSKRGQPGYEHETICGIGRTHENTRLMINMLHSITDKLKQILKKDEIWFLDSSCGDMFWMPEFLNSRSDVIFTGYDLDEGNIKSNRGKTQLHASLLKLKVMDPEFFH